MKEFSEDSAIWVNQCSKPLPPQCFPACRHVLNERVMGREVRFFSSGYYLQAQRCIQVVCQVARFWPK